MRLGARIRQKLFGFPKVFQLCHSAAAVHVCWLPFFALGDLRAISEDCEGNVVRARFAVPRHAQSAVSAGVCSWDWSSGPESLLHSMLEAPESAKLRPWQKTVSSLDR